METVPLETVPEVNRVYNVHLLYSQYLMYSQLHGNSQIYGDTATNSQIYCKKETHFIIRKPVLLYKQYVK